MPNIILSNLKETVFDPFLVGRLFREISEVTGLSVKYIFLVPNFDLKVTRIDHNGKSTISPYIHVTVEWFDDHGQTQKDRVAELIDAFILSQCGKSTDLRFVEFKNGDLYREGKLIRKQP